MYGGLFLLRGTAVTTSGVGAPFAGASVFYVAPDLQY